MVNLADFVNENTDMIEVYLYFDWYPNQFLTALDYFQDLEFVLSLFQKGKYLGHYESYERWGEEEIGSKINISYHSYVDFEKYARDRELERSVKFIEAAEGYYVFNLEP